MLLKAYTKNANWRFFNQGLALNCIMIINLLTKVTDLILKLDVEFLVFKSAHFKKIAFILTTLTISSRSYFFWRIRVKVEIKNG